jgi:DNA-binding NtrC family response regulator
VAPLDALEYTFDRANLVENYGQLRENVMQTKHYVLAVDDEYYVAGFAKWVLDRLGYEVRTARSAVEALAVFSEEKDKYSLLLVDVRMPDVSGVQLVEMVRTEKPELPILFMTVGDGSEIPEGYDCLQKPFTQLDLFAKVRKAIGDRCPVKATG